MMSGCHELELGGLQTGSLGLYLAALGVLRAATGMNGATSIRGCWKNGCFCLYGPATTFNREALCDHLLNRWKPTPFERWWGKAQEASKQRADAIPKERATQTDDRVDQLDAVMVQANRRVFNDLLGTGGNIGKRNLESVWEQCCKLIKKPESGSWLEHALFGVNDVSLPELKSAGTWFVFANKTFNSGQDWYREGRLSPWSFLLAMEGALLLRGGVHRKLGTLTKDKAVFPFMCRPTEPMTEGQVAHGKCEFWAPLWSKPATMTEIEALFRSGLAEVGGRPASAPHEFATAALDAAVDAGVSAFIRFELRRTTSANTFEALPREHIHVQRRRDQRHSELLLPLITRGWFDRIPNEPKDSKQRGKFVGLRGHVEAAIIRLAEDPDDPERWKHLLLLLARTQERIDRSKSLRERCSPLPPLMPSWFQRAWPVPPIELQIARAIASIGTRTNQHDGGAEPLVLFNIFGVKQESGGRMSFPKARPAYAVWHNGRPIRVLIEILKRRLVDAGELDLIPLHGTRPCSLHAIACFLNGEGCDDEIVARWIPPLALIDWKRTQSKESKGIGSSRLPLHPLYSLFRPLIDPEGLIIGGRPLFSVQEDDSRRPHTAAIRMLVNLILQGDIDHAVELARRHYLAAGWRTFEPPTREMHVDCERLAAALLIPVDPAELAARVAQDWLISTN